MREQNYAISFAQKRLWLIDQFDQSGSAYNITFDQLFSELDVEAAKKTIEFLFSRHEILRTSFKIQDGEPKQVVHDMSFFKEVLFYHDLSHLPYATAAAREIVSGEFNYQFDLENEPLIRSTLVKLNDGTYYFAFVVHHIIFDGWSMKVFMDELQQIYQAFNAGQTPSLPPLNSQYKEYSIWQLDQYNKGKFEASRKFWERTLAEEVPEMNLFATQRRPATKNFNGVSASISLGKEKTRLLNEYCIRNHTTMLIPLVSVLKTLFYKYSGVDDQVIGTVVSGRENLDLEHQLGFYVNTLPLRTKFNGQEDSFQELFNKVRESMMNLFEHQYYPFDLMVDELNVKRKAGHNPIFDIMVTMDQDGEKRVTNDSFRNINEVLIEENEVCKFDMMINIASQGEDTFLSFVFDPEIYPRESVTQLLKHYRSILGELLGNPNRKIADVELLSGAEKYEMLQINNVQGFDGFKPLPELFADVLKAHADKPAIVDENEVITYKQLDEISDKVAYLLQSEYGMQPGAVLGVNLDRSKEYLIMLLSAVKIGVGYLPVDLNVPEERLHYMLEKADCKYLVTSNEHLSSNQTVDSTLVGQLIEKAQQVSEYSLDTENIDLNTLAYIIFTSGSSGKPKGVMVSQNSIINLSLWYQQTIGITHESRTTLFVSTSFDVSGMEVWPTFLSGACFYLINDDIRSNPSLLSEFTHKNNLTYIFLPTAFYHDFNNEQLLPKGATIVTGGEKLKRKGNGSWRLFNLYGPTETTVISVGTEIMISERDYPIGRPIWNTSTYILDKDLKMVPKNVLGELHIGGAGVAKGYVNDEELTAKAFIKNPFNPAEIIYKTGDLVYWDDEYQMHFVKRINNKQIKLRGYRIEVDEIEKNLLAIDGLNQAVVCLVEQGGKVSSLAGFYIGDVSSGAVAESLRKSLPDYMIPDQLIAVEEFPRNTNDKIDQKKLIKSLELMTANQSGVISKELKSPQTPTEEYLYKLWKEIFASDDDFSTEESFFKLGGHSLGAMKLVNRIHHDLQKTIFIKDIFNHYTIVKLGEHLDNDDDQTEVVHQGLSGLSEIKEGVPNIYCIPPVIGSGIVFLNLASQLQGKANLYGFDYPGFHNFDEKVDSVQEIAEVFVGQLLEKFPDEQEYKLLGYSLGVLISFEMAKILENQGKKLSLIFLDRPEQLPKILDKIYQLSDAELESLFISEFGFIKADMGEERYLQVKELFKHNLTLGIQIKKADGVVDADITAIQSEKSRTMEGWENHTNGNFIHEVVSGNHYEVLTETNMPMVKQIVSRVINKSKEKFRVDFF